MTGGGEGGVAGLGTGTAVGRAGTAAEGAALGAVGATGIGFAAGAGATGGAETADDVVPFFIASSRSNSLIVFGAVVGFGCGWGATDIPVDPAVGFTGAENEVDEFAEDVGDTGLGIFGVITPSFTTGSCVPCRDQPATLFVVLGFTGAVGVTAGR
jgi:hypothetical protein